LGAGVGLGQSVVMVIIGGLLLLISLALKADGSAPAPGLFPGARFVKRAAVVGGVIVVVDALAAVLVAKGEAAAHAWFHIVVGVACMCLFLALGLVWRPPGDSRAAIFRASLLLAFWVSSVAVLLEGLGAGGYDSQNAGDRIPALTTLHNSVTGIAGFGLLLFPLVMIVLAVILVKLAMARISHRDEAAA
jgi:hypothetical protein